MAHIQKFESFKQVNEEIGPLPSGTKSIPNVKVESLEIEDLMGHKLLIITDENGKNYKVEIDH